MNSLVSRLNESMGVHNKTSFDTTLDFYGYKYLVKHDDKTLANQSHGSKWIESFEALQKYFYDLTKDGIISDVILEQYKDDAMGYDHEVIRSHVFSWVGFYWKRMDKLVSLLERLDEEIDKKKQLDLGASLATYSGIEQDFSDLPAYQGISEDGEKEDIKS